MGYIVGLRLASRPQNAHFERILSKCRRQRQPRHVTAVHDYLCHLRNYPTVLVEAVDGVRWSPFAVLRARISCSCLRIMGRDKLPNVVGRSLSPDFKEPRIANLICECRSALIKVAPTSGVQLHQDLLDTVLGFVALQTNFQRMHVD